MSDWRELQRDDEEGLRFAVIGAAAPASPLVPMLRAAFKAVETPARVEPLEPSEEDFEDCVGHLAQIGFHGASILNPHKVHAARIAERFWVVRHSLGVANALKFEGGIFAQNTEVPGVAQCLSKVPPGTALVLGAGHGARSVVLALLEANWKVRAWNRNAMKTRLLRTLLARYGEIDLVTQPDPSGCTLVVNTTPVGVKIGEQPPLRWEFVRRGTTFCDLVHRHIPTDFLRNASNRGLPTIDGRELVVEQAAEALEWWLGGTAPRAEMRKAIGLQG